MHPLGKREWTMGRSEHHIAEDHVHVHQNFGTSKDLEFRSPMVEDIVVLFSMNLIEHCRWSYPLEGCIHPDDKTSSRPLGGYWDDTSIHSKPILKAENGDISKNE